MIPPTLFLICIVLMISVKSLITVKEVFSAPYNYFGIVLILSGLVMTIVVRKQFDSMKTEIHTFKNPDRLVTKGFFSITRNPIYLGFTLSLTGVWVLLGTILPIVGCLLFFLATNFWYIPYEEEVMEKTFKDEYIAYKAKVRRWI